MGADEHIERRTEMRVYDARRSRVLGRNRAGGIALALVVGVAALLSANLLLQRGEVVDGVHVSGVQLGGRSFAAARKLINRTVSAQLQRPVSLVVDGRHSEISPWKLGVRVDAAATARRALSAGRVRGGLLLSLGYSREIAPVLRLPATFNAPGTLRAVTRAAVDARLVYRRDGTARVVPGKPGVGFDRAGALRAISAAALAHGGTVSLAPRPTEPAISTEAATRAHARLTQLLSAPISFTRRGVEVGELPPRRLAAMIEVKLYLHEIGVAFAPLLVKRELALDVAGYVRKPRDARWAYGNPTIGSKVKVLSSLTGVALDGRATARHMNRAGTADGARGRTAALNFRIVAPGRTTAEARKLGISVVSGAYTSDMGVSSANRIYNVGLLVRYLDGYVIPPKAIFSFNTAVGPRTAERGFREGQAIENGLLVKSIGGGVCQVATTVFDAAFLGGYSILERHNHSFYISHYVKGLDATVADGGFDLRFANDTDHAIVIRTSMTPKTMTVVFLSHPTGRTVSWKAGVESNFSEPKTRHIADSETPAKTIEQQTLGERGFDITVRRIVKNADGSVLREGDFPSHYTAEDIVFKVGKGAQLPADATFEGPAGWVAATDTTTGTTDTTGTGTGTTDTTATGTTATTTTGTTATGTTTTG